MNLISTDEQRRLGELERQACGLTHRLILLFLRESDRDRLTRLLAVIHKARLRVERRRLARITGGG